MNPASEKFLFNVNIFDPQTEPEAPPPPVFSESEIAEARRLGFEEGKRAGIKENTEAREKTIVQILDTIAKHYAGLFAAEFEREKRFEREAVEVAKAVFENLFPVFQKKFGFDEMINVMTEILQRQQGSKTINILVAHDAVQNVSERINAIKASGAEINFNVMADDTIGPGACRMAWADGGAAHDPAARAAQISAALKDILENTSMINNAVQQ
jgi:flagellar assembly protein FliH